MGSSTGWTRRIAAVLLGVMATGAVMVVAAGDATASVCEQPSTVGNATVYAGAATVGVGQGNVGTLNHDVVACADAGLPQSVAVDVTPQGTVGASVTATTCVDVFWYCTPYQQGGGAYVNPPSGAPSPTVDPPQDDNMRVGFDLGTGGTACAWTWPWDPALTGFSCGGANTWGEFDLPVITPDPVGFVNFVVDESQNGVPNYLRWCTDPLFWGSGIDGMVVWCYIVLTALGGAALGALI